MIHNEIKIQRKLDHPNIVKMHELYELENEICIVMDYVPGERLFDHISRARTFDEAEAASLLSQLLLALGYLESKDIIHRDIKIENIMLVRDRSDRFSLKLIDFGLSTFTYSKDAIKKCGTPGYVAPEMLRGEPYDGKVDLFSAGVVLFIWYPLYSFYCYNP